MSLVLAFPDWPEADRDLWQSLYLPSNPLDDGGALVHLRQTSRDTLMAHYGRWLKWLAEMDPGALTEPPVKRATAERLQSWLMDLAHTQPMTRLAFIGNTVRLLKAGDPAADWRQRDRLVKHLKLSAGRGDPRRKAGRVLDSGVLFAAGLQLATTTADGATSRPEELKHRRDGTMVAFLAILPIRLRAFCGLALDTSIFFAPGVITIALPPDLTKTGVPWETTAPPPLVPLLQRYHEEVRPALMAAGNSRHDMLWVNGTGGYYHDNYLSRRIGDITEGITGVRVSPHLFRDAAATTLSRRSPDAAKLISPVLAHSGTRTAEQHYIHAGTIDAGRGLAAVVQRVKGNGR